MSRFSRNPQDIAEHFAAPDEARERAKSPLGQQFFTHRGRLIDKWVDYLDLYDRYFSPWRDTDVVFLELGVFEGGSLEMWREYFGPKATICGIDIDPACAVKVDAPNIVRIGSQDDPAFLQTVINEIGRPHIILDDGSHIARHQRASFDSLWPDLRTGGIYAIEDLYTAYWRGGFEGGYR